MDNGNNGSWRRKKRGRERLFLVIILFVLCVLVTAGVLIVVSVFDHRARNTYVSFYDAYHDLDPDVVYIVMGDQMLDDKYSPMLIDGVLYFRHDFVAEYIDKYLFWEPDSNRLTVTTGGKVYKFTAGSGGYTVNMDTDAELDSPIIAEDGAAYLPESLMTELYDITIYYDANYLPNLLVLTDLYDGRDTVNGFIGGVAKLRYEPDPKGGIYNDLPEGTRVIIYGEPQKSGKEEFIRVRTENGVVGYVLTSEIANTRTDEGRERPEDDYAPEVAKDGKIVMAWHYFGTVGQSSAKSEQKTEKGLDVVSPTWFSFNEEKLDGTIEMLGNKEYTRWAHSQGLQVWGLITDNFKYEVSGAVLTVTENRERAVRLLVNYAEFFELDGINIDFEMIRQSDVKYYLQFLRELYPLLRERGMVLSVDMYTPSNWNLYYNRTEVAKTCDFVIVMAYDEYWSTAPESGPNASISFVKNGIVNTLKEVPPEKLILGIPFFVRVWREETDANGKVTPTSRTYSMNAARELFDKNGAEFSWNRATANYYAEYTAKENGNNVLYRVWLEDERSMEEKLKLVDEYGIAGVSAWRKGLEKASIWQLIYDYMKE